jgi:hypothetical protein
MGARNVKEKSDRKRDREWDGGSREDLYTQRPTAEQPSQAKTLPVRTSSRGEKYLITVRAAG